MVILHVGTFVGQMGVMCFWWIWRGVRVFKLGREMDEVDRL